MKQTQYSRILQHLRKHRKATTWELSQAARSLSVHKRVDEMTFTDHNGEGKLIDDQRERITREPIKINGRKVTLYRLVRA